MKKIFLITLYIAGFVTVSNAQMSKLAANYFNNGEYEKAAPLYKKLYLKNNFNDTYFIYYYKSLMYDEKYEEAIDVIKKQFKAKPNQLYLLVHEGNLYEKINEPEKAEKLYKKAIDKIGSDKIQIIKLANAFKEYSYYNYARQAYQKGVEKVDDNILFLMYLGELSSLENDYDKMIDYYIAYLKKSDNRYSGQNIKSKLSKSLSKDKMILLRNKLVKSIQENPDNISLIDVLSWVYLQLGEYEKARRQITAMDRRFGENGARVYKFAQDAYKAGQYATAAKSYQYIIENKSKNSPYFMMSIRRYLNITSEILVQDTSTTHEDFLDIENQYKKFLNQFGIGDQTAELVIELAKLEAYNLHNVDKGIKILKDLIKRNYIDPRFIAKAKIVLGDLYMIKGEVWESSLLYSQVDKDFKEGELGELARYKNAKLYYYEGDFEWAQIIFNILKPATTRVISNDAIESSVFITESIGEDSIVKPLQMYAKAELLVYQNKFDDAISSLDSINFLFPKNNLEDDIWYLKAHIFKKLKKYDLAKKMYEQVIEKYPDELKADNSIFELAEMYENIFDDKNMAKTLYEKLFLDYDNSTLAVEARKKYRNLSGENVQ